MGNQAEVVQQPEAWRDESLPAVTRIAFVSGGMGGIGTAICRRLGRAGHTVVAGCVGIAGSAIIGRYCQLGGAAMIHGHITLCDQVVVSGGTLISRSINETGFYSGVFPFMVNRDWERNAAVVRHLRELRERLRALESRLGSALENKDLGITANAILPGTIDTEANRQWGSPEERAKWVSPDRIAALAVFLTSDAAADISGAALPMYGGA